MCVRVCFADAADMLSCLVNKQSVENTNLLSCVKCRSVLPQNFNSGQSVTLSAVRSDHAAQPVSYKDHFFSGFGLVPARSFVPQKQSEAVECVIVIDDDDDADQLLVQRGSCISDLFRTTRTLRADVEANGNATLRLLQPSSRLRKLLSIDISSPLGLRTLQHVVSTLNNDAQPLNPCTVSHSLAGSDNTLDYGTFCRTPVKTKFTGRLRQRDFPVKYRHSLAHYHYYCFSRADRQRFCERFDTGLSLRSRRLQQKYDLCSVTLERLSPDEISDWRMSQRLCEYVARMEAKERAQKEKAEKEKAEKAAARIKSHRPNATADEVICLSSDSEDEVTEISPNQDHVFRCHQCDIQLSCGSSFRSLICDHYRTCHDIFNIDIVRIVQPDGSESMQVVNMVPMATDSQTSSASSSPAPQNGSLLHLQQPSPSQSHTYVATHSVPDRVSGTTCHSSTVNGIGDQMQAASVSTNTALSMPYSHMLKQLTQNIQPCETMSRSVLLPRQLCYNNSAVLNGGGMMCGGDAAMNSMSVAFQSSCDADVICLD